MKKVLYIVILIILIILSVFIYFGVSIINSPEYALKQIANDIEQSGIDGLMPHLTDEAQETVSAITAITENKMVNSILTFIDKDNYVGVLKSNLNDVEWTLDDVLEGDEKADAVIGFNYDDKLIGTIEIKMVKKNSEWKINGLDMPKFTKFDLKG